MTDVKLHAPTPTQTQPCSMQTHQSLYRQQIFLILHAYLQYPQPYPCNIIMRMASSTPDNSRIKLNQSQLDGRQLQKMRNKIKMRKRLYDDTQYHSIHFRIRQCEQHVRAERSQAIRDEATRILRRRHSEQEKKKQVQYNVRALKEMEEKKPNFRANRRSKTELTSVDATIFEYQLVPNFSHQRYKLSPSPLSNLNTPPRPVDSSQQKPHTRLTKDVYLPTTNNAYQGKHSPQVMKRLTQSRKASRVTTEPLDSPQSRGSLFKARQKQLVRIGKEERGIDRNNQLKHMYNKYQLRASRGDDDALTLMHRSNMLRAQALLSSN